MQSKNLSPRLNWCEGALVLLGVTLVPLFHWPWIGGADPFTTAKTTLLACLVAAFAVVRAGRLVFETDLDRRAMGVSVLGFLALLWGVANLASLLIQPYPGHFFRVSLLQWLFIAWVWLLSGVARPERLLKPLIVTVVATGSLIALIGITQAIRPKALSWFLPYAGAAGDVRHIVFSTLGNPEYLGGYLAGIMVLTFGVMLRVRRWLLAGVLILAAVIQMIALIRTGARGAWFGALAGLMVITAIELKRHHSIGKLVSIAAILVMLGGGLLFLFSTANPLNPYRANFLKRLQELRDPQSESVRHRLALLLAGTSMIREHPWLGVGPGHFPNAFFLEIDRLERNDASGAIGDYLRLLKGRNPDHAHNDPLEIWIETGTLGLAAFLAVLAWGLASMIGASLRPGEFSGMIGIALAFLVAILVESPFSFPFHLPTRGLIFWTLLGIASIAAMRPATVEEQGPADADTVPAERV